MTPRHTIDDFVNAFGLKQKGKEFVGPCPVCKDGEDRFHVREGNAGPIFGCRYCIDGEQDADGSNAKQVLSLLRNGTAGAPTTPAPRAPRKPAEPPKPQPLPSGNGVTVYHYTDANWEPILAVVRRDRQDGKSFSQWTPDPNNNELWIPRTATPPFPLYGLASIVGERGDKSAKLLPKVAKVGIVEGEKCVHACRAAWPNQTTTCWAGGTNAWDKSDWLPLSGRAVSLVADGDVPGHKAMLALAAHLHGLGCKVKIALPPVEWDSDIADWIAEQGKDGAAKMLKELLHDYEPPEPEPPPDPPADLFEIPAEPLDNNPHYRLLGLQGTGLAFALREAGRMEIIGRRDISSVNALISVAPLEWWCEFVGNDKITVEQARVFGSTLIRMADRLGQIDVSLQVGRGAIRLDDGKVAYHLGNRLLIGGHIYALQDDDSRVWLSEPELSYGDEANAQHTADIARAVMGYRWATPNDGRRFLGWLVASLVGGALQWRPHLLLTAPAAQGKTWLLTNVLEPIMGNMMTSVSDATPASISRLTAYSSLPVAIDEAEPSDDWVVELLKTLRAASSDFGSRVRATADGGVSFQQARFCALLAGTVAPALAKADDSRLSPVGLGPPVDDWPQVRLAIRNAMKHADSVRHRIIRRAGEIVTAADTLTDEMQDLGMDSREAMSSAALTAGWRFWGVDDREVHAQPETSSRSDASDALLEILALRERGDGPAERSVLQMLHIESLHAILADLLGVRRDGEGVMIAINHPGLANKMAKTKWGRANLRNLLMQLDGAVVTASPRSFGGLKKRAVVIPYETLTEIGVEFSDDNPATALG